MNPHQLERFCWALLPVDRIRKSSCLRSRLFDFPNLALFHYWIFFFEPWNAAFSFSMECDIPPQKIMPPSSAALTVENHWSCVMATAEKPEIWINLVPVTTWLILLLRFSAIQQVFIEQLLCALDLKGSRCTYIFKSILGEGTPWPKKGLNVFTGRI